MRVLVLGAYGLIGLQIVRALRAAGHDVIGHGRSLRRGRRAAPDINWIELDLARVRVPQDWRAALANVDAVVNAAGALQDGARDNLAAVQTRALLHLYAACAERGEAAPILVQISAPGAEPGAKTAFMATKAAADAALRASPLRWTILKPALVISANAYGGTALLRVLAAFPWVQPLMLADRPVQTIAADDLAAAVLDVLEGRVPPRRDYELAESEARTLEATVAAIRRWLGFPPARAVLRAPPAVGFALARLADLAGWLGWRSPLRTTALRVLADGVVADPAPWLAAGGRGFKSLEETLTTLPATTQERLFARAQLVFPLALLTLGGFWIASGVIGLIERDAASAQLAATPLRDLAAPLVLAGSAADLAVGLGLLVRPWTRAVALASLALAGGYVFAATILTPHLWADPLGPLVKVFPALALALVVAALAEER